MVLNSRISSSEIGVVMACAGDVPTTETLAAAWLLSRDIPELKLRVVNVVDLMTLSPPESHPHGLNREAFIDLFTEETPVYFAFHGYPRVIHDLVHGRPNPQRFHVRGYIEEGTTTTPFDMVVLNGISRFHLAMDAIQSLDSPPLNAREVVDRYAAKLEEHRRYIRLHLDDMPEIRDWIWGFSQGVSIE